MNFSCSEYGEDNALANMYPDFFRIPNWYCDVGCAQSDWLSNTKFLRDLGWSGIHIDGNAGWAPFWPPGSFIHAIIHTEPRVHFEAHDCKELSRVTGEFPNTDAVTLESILEARHVDGIGLLSVDAEGSEYEVIRSMDLEKHKPQFIISEYATHGIGEDFRVMEYLTQNGYEVIHKTVANLCYKRC